MLEKLELEIDSLGAGGDGVAKSEDKSYYVPFTLPGEKIVAETTDNRRKPNHLNLLEVKQESEDRVTPFCKNFGECGGCAVQHLEISKYKAWKSSILTNALKQQQIDVDLRPLKMVEHKARRRISISYENYKGNIEFGFYRKHSKRIIDIENCPLLTDKLNKLLPALKELLIEITEPRQSGHFLVTDTDLGIDLTFCPRRKVPLEPLNAAFIKFAEQNDIARITRAGKELIIERHKPQIKFGSEYVEFPAGAFLQPSKSGEELLLDESIDFIKKHADRTKKIADLCCGLGTFSIPLTGLGHVTAIDVFGPSVSALKKTSHKGLEVIEQNLFTAPLIAKELEGFDVVVMDPPRCGAIEQVTELSKSTVKTIIYVSCDPGTFARDAKILLDGGYMLKEATPVDQFPYTDHLEVVGCFSR